MARYELRAGAEIDLLTPDEMADQLGGLKDFLRSQAVAPSVEHTPPVTITSTAGGDIGGGAAGTQPVLIYECPVGMLAMVHRIVVDAPSATPAVPLTAGWMRFTRNAAVVGTTEFFLPVNGDIAPVEVDWGSNSGPVLISGETLLVWGASLGNAVQYVIHCQVRVWASTTVRAT